MGSNTNFRNFGDPPTPSPPGSLGLARQSSVYSLTFDEFQNTMGGGMGKDFGSMNMDELLKSIWTAEETQILAASSAGAAVASAGAGGNLQRQGSITLPRTLSQKTVDEVWRNLANDDEPSLVAATASAAVPQRQQTLGEMTLEEFLVRAGIVREETPQTQQMGGGISRPNDNPGFGLPNPVRSNGLFTSGAANQMTQSGLNNPAPISPLSFGGARSSQQQQAFLKPMPMHLASNAQFTGNRSSVVQSRGNCGVTVAAAVSPVSHLSPEVVAVKGGLDSPAASLSPVVPYMFNRRGKCSAALEKVIERRQKRMIKNRESAARSRARKQVRDSGFLVI